MDTLNKEAAVSWGAIATAVGAAVVLLRSFGVSISQSQEDALLKATVLILPIVTALIIRGFVYSKHSTQTKADEAFADGQQGATEPPKVA